MSLALLAGCTALSASLADTEALISATPGPLQVISAHEALQQIRAKHKGSVAKSAVGTVLELPVFPYTFTSPRDGSVYSGTIVGGDPRSGMAGTTNVQVVLIPLEVSFTGSVTATFDPTAPDVGCLGSSTAMELTQQSPVFTPASDFVINGVDVGTATFPDAVQRSAFWSDGQGNPLVSAQPTYHLGLTVQLAAKQSISVANGSVHTVSGTCSTNTVDQVNPPEVGIVDISYVDEQLNAMISSLQLDPSQFPFFVLYGVVMSNASAGVGHRCCILGYHAGSGDASAPGQTYGIGEYDQGYLFGAKIRDVFSIADEVAEWINDPSGNNLSPPYGMIGQVPHSCQNDIEVDDPLKQAFMPPIVMPNGVTYHPAEVAFFSWFMGPVFTGAGGLYSTNGTLVEVANACLPGPTN